MMKKIIAATFATAALATMAIAQSDVPPEVGARQGIMHNYSFSLSVLGGMARGQMPYDAEMAQAAADRLVTLSDINQTGLWPEGTSVEEIEATRALPAIWENMDDFMTGFDDLHQASIAMAEVAGDGQEALGGQMQAIGQACGGCHEDYRVPND